MSCYERLVNCLPKLLKNAAFAKEARKNRKYLDKEGIEVLYRARKGMPIDAADDGFLVDLVMNSYDACAETILTLGWDAERPGGGGAEWLRCCEEVYVITSSDVDAQGPFFSLQEALKVECFNYPAPNPELFSDFLPKRQLLAIAKKIVDWDNQGMIRINEQWYRTSGKRLVLEKKPI